MTLVEMVMGMGVGSLVLAAVMGTSIFTSRNFVAMGNYSDLNASGRNSLGNISEDIRQADFLASYTNTSTGNVLVFQTSDPNNISVKYTLTYTYDSTAQTLTRSLGLRGSTQVNNTVMLTNCTYFHYDLYQRNPSLTNGGDLYPLATYQPKVVKALALSWTCSRAVLGLIQDSEVVQAAKIVIRKN